MEDVGIKIDTYRMGEITARLAEHVEELESRAYELADEEFMLGSTQQLARILFEKLALTPGRKGKTGYSTTRAFCARSGTSARSSRCVEWRELTKLLNTYLGPLPNLLGEDGRLHTHFNQAVAATGRLSTSNPNLRAIPIRTELGREIRSAFVAEPGHRLVSADYSQVELRILAHVSGEPKLREAFARGEDIHAATAAEVLGKDQATLTKDERNIAKMVNSGSSTASRRSGSPRTSRSLAKKRSSTSTRISRASPWCRTSFSARSSGRRATVRDDALRPAPARPGDSRVEPADAITASDWQSTR